MISNAAILLFASLAAVGAAADADYVIRGATLYDGSGAPGSKGDIAIGGERIVAVGTLDVTGNPQIIDGQGLIVAPGFIDLHTHSDRTITKDKTRANINYLMQGVTTVVTGNCGGGPVDVARYLQKVDQRGAGTNVIHLIPHGSLRRQVLQTAARPPTKEELERMKQLAERAMTDGAWGMSTGLIYVPGSFASTDELVQLMKVVGARGGIYATHMRNESTHLLEAIQEALEIGRRANAPVHISHFKVSGPAAWGQAAEAIRLIQQARAQGQRVTADQYPYTASSTSLAAMIIPAAYRSQGKLAAALKDPAKGPQVRQEILKRLKDRGDGRRLVIASYAKHRAWQGRNLAELAEEQQKSVLELALEIQAGGGASMINFSMSEQEVRLIMQQTFVATASDGSAQDIASKTLPHPRNYGCFPRKIGRYAIAGNTISLQQAIRSCTGLPADILKLPERGYLRAGYFADVVLFDPRTFRDRATYENPHQYATGVRYLFVNGTPAIEEGKFTGALSGKALRHMPRR